MKNLGRSFAICVVMLLFGFRANAGSIVGEWQSCGPLPDIDPLTIMCAFDPEGSFRVTRAGCPPDVAPSMVTGKYDVSRSQIFFTVSAPRIRVVVLSYRIERDYLVLTANGREVLILKRRPSL